MKRNNLDKQDIFTARTEGYYWYRIPVLAAMKNGVLLAFCEARRGRGGDWDPSDIVMKRSSDHGETWGNLCVIASGETVPYHNVTVIYDQQTDILHVLYCSNYDTAYHIVSTDGGLHFSGPQDITSAFDSFKTSFDWKVIAIGPGHGIKLHNGRYVAAVWLALEKAHRPSAVSTIVSDDQGATWRAGEIVPNDILDPSETIPMELECGAVLLNMRNLDERHRRSVTVSENGADGWTPAAYDMSLYEPGCLGDLLKVTDGGKNYCLFVNPTGGSTDAEHPCIRKNLTLKVSTDDCKSWVYSKLLQDGYAGYAVLAETDGLICCLYENGNYFNRDDSTQALRLARFRLDSILK